MVSVPAHKPNPRRLVEYFCPEKTAHAAELVSMQILVSFREPTNESNPYVVLLLDELKKSVHVHYFSWRAALVGRYDLFHMHWPETMIRSVTSSRLKRAVKLIIMNSVLLRLRVSRTPVVLTVHNLTPHDRGNTTETRMLKKFENAATFRIYLHEADVHESVRSTVILHGHYRDWYARQLEQTCQANSYQFVYFGILKPYKGVESLIDAFLANKDRRWRLVIAGKPESDDYRHEIQQRVAGAQSIAAHLNHVNDDLLSQLVRSSGLVVLPYQTMYNSGSVLLALSLQRPVLVPDTPVNRTLRREVGLKWVILFSGTLSPDDLTRALAKAQRIDRSDAPDLSKREWSATASRHLDIYARLTRG